MRRASLTYLVRALCFVWQFCANDPEVFLKAALLVQEHCDAIDLNLGCPQMIAKRGTPGATLGSAA